MCMSTMRFDLVSAPAGESECVNAVRGAAAPRSPEAEARAAAPAEPRNWRRDFSRAMGFSFDSRGCGEYRSPTNRSWLPDQLERDLQLPIARCRAVDGVELSEGGRSSRVRRLILERIRH